MEKQKVFVVWVGQVESGFACIVGVCSTREKAEQYVNPNDRYSSRKIEECFLDEIDPNWLQRK